jgi:hypothetical protein
MGKTILGPLAYLMSALFLACLQPACSKKGADAGWIATVETVDGIRTIHNPSEPKYGEFVFDLVEDLRFGGDPEKDAYYFPKGASLNVAGEGRLFVCDIGNRRVQVYDPDGSHVMTLGRQGQGPGEYSFPSRVFFDTEGHPCVDNGRSLIVYDRDGAFERNIPVATFLSQKALGPDDTIIGTTQPNLRAEGGPKYSIVRIDPEAGSVLTIAEFPAEYDESQGALFLHWYNNSISFSPRTEDTFCYGWPAEYRILVADGDGRAVLAFTKDEEPAPISGEEKAMTKEEGIFAAIGYAGRPEQADLVFPDHRPFFSRLIGDGEGRIYVVRRQSILERDDPNWRIDVFSKDGVYLYRMSWPFIPAVIGSGSFYGVLEDDETGEFSIVRYRVENWADFRLE